MSVLYLDIVGVGRRAQRYGLRVREHSAFGGVGTHSTPRSYHYRDQAIDITDWRNNNMPEHPGGPVLHWTQRTANLYRRAREIGGFDEILGPGYPGHDEHVHLALVGTRQFTEAQIQYLFTGRWQKEDGAYVYTVPSSNAKALPQPVVSTVPGIEAPSLPDLVPPGAYREELKRLNSPAVAPPTEAANRLRYIGLEQPQQAPSLNTPEIQEAPPPPPETGAPAQLPSAPPPPSAAPEAGSSVQELPVAPYAPEPPGTPPRQEEQPPAQTLPALPPPGREMTQQDWQSAASDPNRITDPRDQAYWNRADIRLWAGANPELARQTAQRYGVEQYQAPTTTPEEANTIEAMKIESEQFRKQYQSGVAELAL